ncbi:bifunctional peptidase and (3S)-lysyl hydroxylase Jmjd7-like [Oratosquilla oratoria]|uniref:bifunctional peptidase and (3S)-lysyl hydroxylase Jmjd7-like n=1 Tax=Oratosquilla oratoria TaxID=337810 RepID=UPI003F76456E
MNTDEEIHNQNNLTSSEEEESKFMDKDGNLMNPAPVGKLRMCCEELSEESKDLYLCTAVPELNHLITPLELYRDWIAPNRPVIFKGAFRSWPAIKKWDSEYLRNKLGEKSVTVAVTPNGYADAPNEGYFVMPEERSMKFKDFLDIMEDPSQTKGVFYIQKQNSNLTDEFQEIMEDTAEEISWFSEALGKEPDAVNFWMGDKRAVTSMHKDHYENIYCVVKGFKDFILLPPTDTPWIPYKKFPAGRYKEIEPGQFIIEEDKETGLVPWVVIDPLQPDLHTYPQYKKANPIICRVHAGDALYLPSLWYHHVQQSHGCIAVNYWYDMEFDIKYTYYKFLQNLTWKEL